MKTNAVSEDIPEFDTKVIGITCVNGMPAGIIFYHDGMLLGANFTDEQVGSVPIMGNNKNRSVTTINAPDGMIATVKGTRLTRDYVNDFKMSRQTTVSYEVVRLEQPS